MTAWGETDPEVIAAATKTPTCPVSNVRAQDPRIQSLKNSELWPSRTLAVMGGPHIRLRRQTRREPAHTSHSKKSTFYAAHAFSWKCSSGSDQEKEVKKKELEETPVKVENDFEMNWNQNGKVEADMEEDLEVDWNNDEAFEADLQKLKRRKFVP